MDYVKQHFVPKRYLQRFAKLKKFSINPSTLSTIFKQQTGKNISSYIEDIRIKEAMRLLRTTDWTINQISEAVGYLTASTFCRAFRRNTGYNTSTYKSMVGEEKAP